MTAGQAFSVDTSALLDGLERFYPIHNFPALWERIDTLVESGRFFISEEVWEEVQARDEAAKAWVEPRRDSLIVPTDRDIAKVVRDILQDHKLLVKAMKNRNRADPFVIAVAKVRGATVVTGEGNDGTRNRPKIPYVCEQMGVPCIRLLELIQEEGWSF